jgi:hypothetical protein
MSSIPKTLQEPTCIPMNFTSVEDILKWIASHEPLWRNFYPTFRILSIAFCVGPTSCSIQICDEGAKSGFVIHYYINKKLVSYKSHLFEKQIFFQYLREYFLTPSEYEQWMKQLEKDIKKSKHLKQLHDSGTCAGRDRCRYCIQEQRDD